MKTKVAGERGEGREHEYYVFSYGGECYEKKECHAQNGN